MRITDDVIRDLLPLYRAGEVSTDTRRLVEAYLEAHPALAEEARREDEWRLPATPPPAETDALDAERMALARTKRLLAWKSWVMAAAIFFTAAPLSFGSTDETGLRWLMWDGHPRLAAGSLVLGLASWAVYLGLRRRLSVRGF